MFQAEFLKTLVLVSALLATGIAPADDFATYHPDQTFREEGLALWQEHKPEQSFEKFQHAARFADKTSQLSLALMYWNGEGVAADKATAYAWADLAAERGYPDFLKLREQMWSDLNEDERARAVVVGTGLYQEYGDDVAKPRLEALLQTGRSHRTSSRTGAKTYGVGVVPINSSGRAAILSQQANHATMGGGSMGGGMMGNRMNTSIGPWIAAMRIANISRPPGRYWSEGKWKPEKYWVAQDELWMPAGHVTVASPKLDGPPRKKEGPE
jgi:hypothetical protein